MTLALSPTSAIVRGHYPTPVERLDALSTDACALWVKRDDLTHPLYGGNKVRKLEHLLADARARGKTRLVTIGAVGSHHVLATTVFGTRAGFSVEAMLVPQRWTAHVEESINADLTQGLVAHPARTYAGAMLGLWSRARSDTALIPVGGSNVTGSLGYVDAARELAAQVEGGALPEPDVVVVTVGSGGTAAGLAAGLTLAGLRTRVLGVIVSTPVWGVRWLAHRLTRQCFFASGGRDARALEGRLTTTDAYVGPGYGEPTSQGREAIARASEVGLALDQTYTGKTFAATLDHVRMARDRVVLYWHTLSSAPMGPLVSERDIPQSVSRLLKRSETGP